MTFAPLQKLAISQLPQTAGKPPVIDWLPLAQLGTDDEYQRPITYRGVFTIENISRDFKWAKFSPVIVTQVGTDKYAIIDGQHRATAALCQGFERVPCYIVKANAQEAAQIFAAVNGVVTPMSAQSVFKAARAGGEQWAVEVDQACREAGVNLLIYPVPKGKMKSGDTLAAGTIRGIHQRRGLAHLQATLCCVMAFTDSLVPGAITSGTINRCSKLFSSRPDWTGQIALLVDSLKSLSLGLASDEQIEAAIKRRIGDGRTSAEAQKIIAERVKDLHERKFKPGMIAATLRIPYADVERALKEIPA